MRRAIATSHGWQWSDYGFPRFYPSVVLRYYRKFASVRGLLPRERTCAFRSRLRVLRLLGFPWLITENLHFLWTTCIRARGTGLEYRYVCWIEIDVWMNLLLFLWNCRKCKVQDFLIFELIFCFGWVSRKLVDNLIDSNCIDCNFIF